MWEVTTTTERLKLQQLYFVVVFTGGLKKN